MMKEHGILYTEANRLAVIEDRKIMTRRIPAAFAEINEKPDEWILGGWDGGYRAFVFYSKQDIKTLRILKVPYAAGDRMYIKEPHYAYGRWTCYPRLDAKYPPAAAEAMPKRKWVFHADKSFGVWFSDNIPPDILARVMPSRAYAEGGSGWFKRSPLFMPKWAARTWRRVTGVKVERLQSITEADAIAEGIEHVACAIYRSPDTGNRTFNSAVAAYHGEWLSINGPGAWEFNPWLLAVAFKRLAERREK